MSSKCLKIRRPTTWNKSILLICFLSVFTAKTTLCRAEDPAPPGEAIPTGTRNFYQVLDDVLSDFEYDLKTGQVVGLKDLSIRNIATSENVPPSFKNHLELLLTERILKTNKTRIVHCPACRSKKATLDGESMVIASSDSNVPEMQRMAKMNGILNFMDIAFAYQPSGMILSLQISDVESGTTLWSKSYNSQLTRASAQRKGIEVKSEDDKLKNEYQTTMQYRPTLSAVLTPKAGSGSATVLAFGLRSTELYDNHTKEVGVEINYYIDTSTLSSQPVSKTATRNIYSEFNLTMLFVHGWNVYGNEDDINKVRGMIFAGAGGTYASGFLGALFRVGYEWRLAKHWSVTGFAGYRPSSNVVIAPATTIALGGMEGGLGVGFIF